MKSRALQRQVGGGHYKGRPIEPVQFIERNGLGYCEGNIVKYICRSRDKNGLEDLNKGHHYLQILMEEHQKRPLPILRTPIIIPVDLFCAGFPELTREEVMVIHGITKWRRVVGTSLNGTLKFSILQDLDKNWHRVVNAWADSSPAGVP